MNEADIKKCIKNGYCWSSCGDKPETTPARDYTRGQLKTFKGLHATKAAAKLAIATRRKKEREAKRKAEAEPLEWCERGDGEKPEQADDWTFNRSVDSQTKSVGRERNHDPSEGWLSRHEDNPIPWMPNTRVGGDLRARYRNPAWIAKHGNGMTLAKPKEDAKVEKMKESSMGFETTDLSSLGYTQDDIDKSEAELLKIVSHPYHYTSHPSGVECITITKHMNFCRGNAVKYLWRAGQKGDSIDKEIEDIAKAEEYCRIEKERLMAKKTEGGAK